MINYDYYRSITQIWLSSSSISITSSRKKLRRFCRIRFRHAYSMPSGQKSFTWLYTLKIVRFMASYSRLLRSFNSSWPTETRQDSSTWKAVFLGRISKQYSKTETRGKRGEESTMLWQASSQIECMPISFFNSLFLVRDRLQRMSPHFSTRDLVSLSWALSSAFNLRSSMLGRYMPVQSWSRSLLQKTMSLRSSTAAVWMCLRGWLTSSQMSLTYLRWMESQRYSWRSKMRVRQRMALEQQVSLLRSSRQRQQAMRLCFQLLSIPRTWTPLMVFDVKSAKCSSCSMQSSMISIRQASCSSVSCFLSFWMILQSSLPSPTSLRSFSTVSLRPSSIFFTVCSTQLSRVALEGCRRSTSQEVKTSQTETSRLRKFSASISLQVSREKIQYSFSMTFSCTLAGSTTHSCFSSILSQFLTTSPTSCLNSPPSSCRKTDTSRFLSPAAAATNSRTDTASWYSPVLRAELMSWRAAVSLRASSLVRKEWEMSLQVSPCRSSCRRCRKRASSWLRRSSRASSSLLFCISYYGNQQL